jgi:hypothetical protein
MMQFSLLRSAKTAVSMLVTACGSATSTSPLTETSTTSGASAGGASAGNHTQVVQSACAKPKGEVECIGNCNFGSGGFPP